MPSRAATTRSPHLAGGEELFERELEVFARRRKLDEEQAQPEPEPHVRVGLSREVVAEQLDRLARLAEVARGDLCQLGLTEQPDRLARFTAT
jgi:hypothetical protein